MSQQLMVSIKMPNPPNVLQSQQLWFSAEAFVMHDIDHISALSWRMTTIELEMVQYQTSFLSSPSY